nr:MAG TPA: hypothetical protein [Caudoviricetes sp.]
MIVIRWGLSLNINQFYRKNLRRLNVFLRLRTI